MPKDNKVIFERSDLEDIVKYLNGAARNVYHINHALFDTDYKSTLDLNNEHDLRTIRVSLFLAVSSINGEIRRLEEKLNEES